MASFRAYALREGPLRPQCGGGGALKRKISLHPSKGCGTGCAKVLENRTISEEFLLYEIDQPLGVI